jgi:hypothetical protein
VIGRIAAGFAGSVRLASIIVMTVTALLLASAAASAPRAGVSTICGQLQGPNIAWKDVTPFGNFDYKGSTWTILAKNVGCSRARAMAPAMLRIWSRPGGNAAVLSGWRCGKWVAQGHVNCFILGRTGFGNDKSVRIWMLAPLTLAQIKKSFGGG